MMLLFSTELFNEDDDGDNYQYDFDSNHVNTNVNDNKGIIKLLKMADKISWDIASQTESCFDANFVVMASSCTANNHYSDVMMGATASQITSLTIVYSTVY